MQVRIDSIGPQGRHLDSVLDEDKVEQELVEVGVEFRPRGGVRVSADLSKSGKTVRFTGRIEAILEGDCRRCLAPVETRLEPEFELSLRPAADVRAPGKPGKDREELGEGEADGSFRLDEADEDVYHGDELDLWPLLREQLLLSLPDYLVCEEDCRGLCQVCGKNLNEVACDCDRDVPDPRLAGLKDIKLS
ncbi:MAG: DUF177 domain-containing protein [Deltaproteobacteria bacterium]|nr:DUF177 domain-containing protein [Deltaproteobacteria bacterium]